MSRRLICVRLKTKNLLPNFIINWKLLIIISTRLFLEVAGSLQEEMCPRTSEEFKPSDSHI